ncbi:hypothetical protein Taro_055099, partial [Colocasia esculenta]|nr:hypothetical protein [Colocasia esculenta]
MNLELARVVWRSSWWLRSCGTTTRSRSSSPSRLLRPAQTTLLKSTKGTSSTQKGRVEELLVAKELWNDHKKPFFFPFSSAATCTKHPIEVDQRKRKDRSAIQGIVLALFEPGTDPMNAMARYVAFRGLIATYPLSPSEGNM